MSMKIDMPKPKPKPTPRETRIWLCKSDIDITSGHTVVFSSRYEQIKYFTDPSRSVLVVDDGEHIRHKSGELLLKKEYAEIDGKYNFLIYINPAHENRYYICNIIDYQYTSDNVTRVFYAIDNLQTYWHDIDFSKKSFIVRRHLSNRKDADKIKDLPYEDLDRGMSNTTVTETLHKISGDESFFVITLSDPIKKSFSGNYTPIYSQFHNEEYIDVYNKTVPIKHNASVTESTIVFIVNDVALLDLVTNVFNTPEHVNKLLKVSYIPFDIDLMGVAKDNMYEHAVGRPVKDGNMTRKLYLPSPSRFARRYGYDVFRNSKQLVRNAIQGDFSFIHDENVSDIKWDEMTPMEKYFMREPFVTSVVYDVHGNISEYGYYSIKTRFTDKLYLNVFGVLGIIPTIAYKVEKGGDYLYNNVLAIHQSGSMNGKSMKASDLDIKYIMPSETISVVNDYTSAFLQGNQNQIAQQKSNMATSFEMRVNDINAQAQRGLTSAKLAHSNSELQRETDVSNFQIRQQVDQNNHQLGMIGQGFNTGLGAIGSLLSGNVGGAVAGAVSGGVNMHLQNQSFGNSLQANSDTFNNSMNTALTIANNNLQHQQSMINSVKAQNLRNASLQNRMAIETMNARMLDVKNMPDSVSSLTGGSLLNVIYNRYHIFLQVRMTSPRVINRLSNYFAEYGFLVNDYESLGSATHTTEYGTFIQTANANITGDLPQTAIQDIKEQLDSGIFIWFKPEHYRNIDLMKKAGKK